MSVLIWLNHPCMSENAYDRVNFEVNGECPVDFMCTEEEVYNMVISLDTTKANGRDRISAKMLKETATSITPSLTKLFNISISSEKFLRSGNSLPLFPFLKLVIVQVLQTIGQFLYFLL